MGRLIRYILTGVLVAGIAVIGVLQWFAYPILFILLFSIPVVQGIGLFWGIVASVVGYILTAWLGMILTGIPLTAINGALILMLEKLNSAEPEHLCENAKTIDIDNEVVSHVCNFIDMMISELNRSEVLINRPVKIILLCQAWAIAYFYHKGRSSASGRSLYESKVKRDFILLSRQPSVVSIFGSLPTESLYSEIKCMLFLIHSKQDKNTDQAKAFQLTMMYSKQFSQDFSDTEALTGLAETLLNSGIRDELKETVHQYGKNIHIK